MYKYNIKKEDGMGGNGKKLIHMLSKRFAKKSKDDKSSNENIEKEADKIFMKLYKRKYKNFPTIDETNRNTEYGKDYDSVYNQVRETRKKKTYSIK